MRLTVLVQRSLILLPLAGLLSCGGDGPMEPPVPVATKLAFVTAPPATAFLDQALSPQPVIQLLDATGTAVAKAGVVLKASFDGTTVLGANATTTSDGRATFTELVLRGGPGSFTLRFTTPLMAGVTPLEHQVELSIFSPSSIEATSIADQAGGAGTPVLVRPTVQVTNASSEPAVGTAVTFTVVSGEGTLVDPVQLTDANGMATVGNWIMGLAPGINSIRASAAGVPGSATFTATGILFGQADGEPAVVQVAAVGTPTDIAPSVRVRVGAEPIEGARVRFRVASGEGTVAVEETLTNAAGEASSGTWTVGATPGENILEAEVPAYAAEPLRFRAWGLDALPGTVVMVAGDGQTVDAGQMLPIPPAVRVQDAAGTPLVGFPVTFTLEEDDAGVITGAAAVTNSDGVAAIGGWQLPLANGTWHLEATAPTLDGSPVIFTATVLDNSPGVIEVVSGAITAQVATAVTTLPRVRVRTVGGNPLAGVPVEFSVASGGGTVTGGAAVTNASGDASPSSWTLGTVAGQQSVSATVGALAPLTIVATATAGPPAAAVVVQGDNQTGPVYNPLVLDPTVRVEDQYGNAVSGAQVTYGVTLGGGRITHTTQFADANGEARARWVLGGTTGLNRITASFPSLPIAPIQFAATATAVSSSFNIEILYVGSPSVAEQEAVDAAVARWRTIVQGDISDVQVTLAAATCTDHQLAIDELVDDLLILVDFSNIDGPGSILGSAGPCALRGSTSLPAFGTITIDGADAAQLAADGELRDVMLHEMAHVLGVGTIWDNKNLLVGEGGSNPQYTGTAAKQAYNGLGGTQVNVPVENTGGPGTADAHWRETVFDRELMTGFIGGTDNPLTKVTSRSLLDLGYVIDDATADPLGFTLNLRRDVQAARARVPVRRLREQPLTGPIIVIDPDGTTRKVPR